MYLAVMIENLEWWQHAMVAAVLIGIPAGFVYIGYRIRKSRKKKTEHPSYNGPK